MSKLKEEAERLLGDCDICVTKHKKQLVVLRLKTQKR